MTRLKILFATFGTDKEVTRAERGALTGFFIALDDHINFKLELLEQERERERTASAVCECGTDLR